MNKQAEYYELTGDKLAGSKAERAYRAAQNHLQISDTGYPQDLQRLQAKMLTTWGGKREGAGRPATGAMPTRALRMTDEEFMAVKEFLDKRRKASRG
jgi:hypothetical protein